MRNRCRNTPFLVAACLLFTAAFAFSQAAAKSANTHRRRQDESSRLASAGPGADIHVVKQGDTLYRIARAHRISIAALKATNNLRTNRLSIGQILRLSAVPEVTERRTGKVTSSAISDTAERAAAESVEEAESGDETPPQVPVPVDILEPPVASTDEAPELRPVLDDKPLRLQLADTGVGMLGVRYRWNGISEKRGFDCSGLVKSLFDKFNISLPRSSREQFKIGEKVERDKLEIGDLVFFSSRGRTPSHVGIYLGDNQFLHAARRARRVIISNLTDRWYTKRFLGARRLLDLWTQEPAPAETGPN